MKSKKGYYFNPQTDIRLGSSNIPGAGLGVFSRKHIPPYTILGTYKGVYLDMDEYNERYESDPNMWIYAFFVSSGKSEDFVIDASDPKKSNWTRYMNCSRCPKEENVAYLDHNGKIYFATLCDIKPGDELMFFYGDDYAKQLGIYYAGGIDD